VATWIRCCVVFGTHRDVSGYTAELSKKETSHTFTSRTFNSEYLVQQLRDIEAEQEARATTAGAISEKV
jgi:hypothetical protein